MSLRPMNVDTSIVAMKDKKKRASEVNGIDPTRGMDTGSTVSLNDS